jgi:hypothetical protein
MTDTTTMTGAQFRRHAGTDPEKWSEAFWQTYDSDGPMPLDERVGFAAGWFRDAMEAAAAEAVGRDTAAVTAAQCPTTS